jgi:hypothetical protein
MYTDPTGHWRDDAEKEYASKNWDTDDYQRVEALSNLWIKLNDDLKGYKEGTARYAEIRALRDSYNDESNKIRSKYFVGPSTTANNGSINDSLKTGIVAKGQNLYNQYGELLYLVGAGIACPYAPAPASMLEQANAGKLNLMPQSQYDEVLRNLRETAKSYSGLDLKDINVLDLLQTALDIGGMIPVIGEPFDGANAVIYYIRGDNVSALLSAGAVVPFLGNGVTGLKLTERGLKYADEVGELVKGTEKTGTDMARKLGKEGENAAGIKGSKQRIESLSGTANYRIPDELLQDEKILREIKNVKSQSFTNQLKDFNAWAKENGYKFILEVRPGAKLSGPLQDAINKGDIILKDIGK